MVAVVTFNLITELHSISSLLDSKRVDIFIITRFSLFIACNCLENYLTFSVSGESTHNLTCFFFATHSFLPPLSLDVCCPFDFCFSAFGCLCLVWPGFFPVFRGVSLLTFSAVLEDRLVSCVVPTPVSFWLLPSNLSLLFLSFLSELSSGEILDVLFLCFGL